MAGEYSHAERLQVSGLLEVTKCSLQLTMQLIASREGLVTASSRSQTAAEAKLGTLDQQVRCSSRSVQLLGKVCH